MCQKYPQNAHDTDSYQRRHGIALCKQTPHPTSLQGQAQRQIKRKGLYIPGWYGCCLLKYLEALAGWAVPSRQKQEQQVAAVPP